MRTGVPSIACPGQNETDAVGSSAGSGTGNSSSTTPNLSLTYDEDMSRNVVVARFVLAGTSNFIFVVAKKRKKKRKKKGGDRFFLCGR